MSNLITTEQLTAACTQCTVTNEAFITLQTTPALWLSTATQLKEQFQLHMPVNITGTDRGEEIEVTLHIRNTATWQTIALRTHAPIDEALGLDSLSALYPAAEFFEREIFDLLGLRFNNHPDLRRLYLDEEFEGNPLRKSFKIESSSNN